MKNTHNNKTNFPVNATKGAQVLALVFVIGAAVFTNGDQTAIAANASVQPHSGILISTPPPPPPPTHNLKARKGAYNAFKGHSRANSFADFYKQRQIELFSALDNALSQKAEDALTEFAAVKNAEVQLQTSLGNRKGQLGINLIGAFAESQNHGIGWQVRVYGAQQDGKGFNAGVFYRRLSGDILFGANAFVDYENHKLGNFYRYSIGGEAQNRYGSFAANYYVPITDEKHKDGGVIFSRKGYDAKLRLNIPNAKFLKAAVDYYNFGDEHGAESDDGFRYGAEAHLIPGLRLGLFYDDGGEELGGEVLYIHTIGEVQQAQTANEQWTPDLFAAVSREHSQRIISVNVAPQIFAINRTPFIVGVQGAIITVLIPGGGIHSSGLPSNFMLANNNSVLLFSAAIAGATTQAIIITSAVQTITTSVAITAQNAPPFNAGFNVAYSGGVSDLSVHFYTDIQNTVGTIVPSGGSGEYTLSLLPPLVGFSLAGNAVLFSVAGNTGNTVMATITADDDNEHTPPATIAVTARAISVFTAEADVLVLSIRANNGIFRILNDIRGIGGAGGWVSEFQSPPAAPTVYYNNTNTSIFWQTRTVATVTLTVIFNDRDSDLTPPVSLIYTLRATL